MPRPWDPHFSLAPKVFRWEDQDGERTGQPRVSSKMRTPILRHVCVPKPWFTSPSAPRKPPGQGCGQMTREQGLFSNPPQNSALGGWGRKVSQ